MATTVLTTRMLSLRSLPHTQTTFLILIIGANFGLGFAVVKLTKDTEVCDDAGRDQHVT
jgi:hypothetical protein